MRAIARKLPNTHLRFVPLAGFPGSPSAVWGLAKAFAFAFALAAAFAAATAAVLSALRPLRRCGFSPFFSALGSLGRIVLAKSKGREENLIPNGCTHKSLAWLTTLEILRVVGITGRMPWYQAEFPGPHAAFQAQPIHRPQVDPRPKR